MLPCDTLIIFLNLLIDFYILLQVVVNNLSLDIDRFIVKLFFFIYTSFEVYVCVVFNCRQ